MASRFGCEWLYYDGGVEVTRWKNNKGPLLRTPGNVLCFVDGARGAKTSTCVLEGGCAGRARWSASQYHNNAAIKYTRPSERDSVRARALTLVVTKEKWRV